MIVPFIQNIDIVCASHDSRAGGEIKDHRLGFWVHKSAS